MNTGGSSGQGGISGSGGGGASGGGGIAGGGASGTGGCAALTSLLWVRHAPGATSLSGTSLGDSLAALSGGDIIVTGSYTNSIRFGAGEPSEMTLTLPSTNAFEGYIARYRGDGSFVGAKRIPGAGSSFYATFHAAPTADGGFILTGKRHRPHHTGSR